MENWKKVLGFKHDYEVSDLGRVRNLSYGDGEPTYGSLDTRGYLKTSLVTKEGKTITKKMHRLVAEYFIEGFDAKLTINHIDFDKQNNRAENLECLTASENVLHYLDNMLMQSSSSKERGIGFHCGINKWTCRVTVDKKRYNLGVFDTEMQAILARKKFLNGEGELKIGKGKSNKGRSKYTETQKQEALELAAKIGVRKAGAITGMGSTKISKLRKELNQLK